MKKEQDRHRTCLRMEFYFPADFGFSTLFTYCLFAIIACFEKAKLSAPHLAEVNLSAGTAVILPGKWPSGSHFALLYIGPVLSQVPRISSCSVCLNLVSNPQKKYHTANPRM